MDTGLAGKAVVVTGGAGGIGKACARRFLEEKATVFLADVSRDGLTAAAEELSVTGRSRAPRSRSTSAGWRTVNAWCPRRWRRPARWTCS